MHCWLWLRHSRSLANDRWSLPIRHSVMDIHFNHDIRGRINREVEVDAISQSRGGLHVEAGVRRIAFALFLLPHRGCAEEADVHSKAEPDVDYQAVDENNVLFMFGGDRPNLQGSIVVADAQAVAGFADLFEKLFVLVPGDVVKDPDC